MIRGIGEYVFPKSFLEALLCMSLVTFIGLEQLSALKPGGMTSLGADCE